MVNYSPYIISNKSSPANVRRDVLGNYTIYDNIVLYNQHTAVVSAHIVQWHRNAKSMRVPRSESRSMLLVRCCWWGPIFLATGVAVINYSGFTIARVESACWGERSCRQHDNVYKQNTWNLGQIACEFVGPLWNNGHDFSSKLNGHLMVHNHKNEYDCRCYGYAKMVRAFCNRVVVLVEQFRTPNVVRMLVVVAVDVAADSTTVRVLAMRAPTGRVATVRSRPKSGRAIAMRIYNYFASRVDPREIAPDVNRK